MKRILGIDPSVRGTGLAIIECDGRRIKYINCMTLELKGTYRFSQCLSYIREEVLEWIDEYYPTKASIEVPPYVKSVTVLQKLGAAYGVCVESCSSRKVDIFQFTPTAIKNSCTGYGKSEKRSVQNYVRGILNLDFLPENDAADALATAITLANKSTELIPDNLKVL